METLEIDMTSEANKYGTMNQPGISPDPVRSVYLIGIGGIGMSALARYFQAAGAQVGGYDRTPTPLTRELEAAGMAIHYQEDLTALPREVDLVVYTPAIPADHAELRYFREHGYRVVKRSDVLQWITQRSFNICVAGTHGKTTITTMVAHLLRDSGYGCNAFLGGISVNYGTNFWSDPRNVFVIEADEYDRSFLKLSPDVAVITAMDPDHLDIYGTGEAVEEAFVSFSRRLKTGGLLICREGLARDRDLQAPRRLTYRLAGETAAVHARNLTVRDGRYCFDVVLPDRTIEQVELHMGGLHNVENSLAAIAVADSLGIDAAAIRKAVAGFRGVKRRFEYVFREGNQVFIDDYAHHPAELDALIAGVRSLFGSRKCTVIFQPHLFTRTRDLAEGFAAALDRADEVILLPIYPAREQPLAGVSSELIASKMKNPRHRVMDRGALLDWLGSSYVTANPAGGVLVSAGAGDIDTLVQPICGMLKEG